MKNRRSFHARDCGIPKIMDRHPSRRWDRFINMQFNAILSSSCHFEHRVGGRSNDAELSEKPYCVAKRPRRCRYPFAGGDFSVWRIGYQSAAEIVAVLVQPGYSCRPRL